MNYFGTIILESLESKRVLKMVKILSTKVESVGENHKTPWLKQWTLHKVEIDEGKAEKVAKLISESIDSSHKSSWYADYKNDLYHYIIFPHKVFKIDNKNESQHTQARKYGTALGIPAHQLDWSTEIK